MSQLIITEANPGQIDSIANFWSYIDRDNLPRPFGGDKQPQKLNHTKDMVRHLIDSDNAIILIAQNQNQLLGTISGHIMNRDTTKLSPIGVIYSLWVEEEYRKQGIGQTLLNEVELALKNKGAQALQVGWETVNTLAETWWQKRGYRPYEVIAKNVS